MSASSGQGAAAAVSLKVVPDPGIALGVRELEVVEELGRPFRATVVVFATDAQSLKSDLTAILGGSATVTIKPPKGQTRYFNGIVVRVTFLGMLDGTYQYLLDLRPWIWLLSQQQDCRVFQNCTVWSLITTVFGDNGFSNYSDKRTQDAGSTTLEYCIQYNEMTLDFLTRLMEEYGLYYYFEHADGQHTLVFADDPASHTNAGSLAYNYDRRERRVVVDQIWDVSFDQHHTPSTWTYRDYNFTTPAADLTAKSIRTPTFTSYASYELYAYPGRYAAASDGSTLAGVAMQHVAAGRTILNAASNSRALFCGGKFTMTGFPDKGIATEYLVTGLSWSIGAAEAAAVAGGEAVDTYASNLVAIPAQTGFKLDRRTPKPVARGPQTALVVGQSGREITTDQYGRIKVQFHWDRLGARNETSSCWIRVAQSWAGPGWGGMVIPRIGMEVVVDFLHGDPDQPIVSGCVYNATNTVPYGLPDNATRSTFKTNSSTGGGGFNELRFEDKAGSEEVFLQAQKDLNVSVLNNRSVTTTEADTLTVSKGNRSVTVQTGDESLTVSQGNRSATISKGNDSLTVSTGNQTVSITAGSSSLSAGKTIALSADQSITLTVGASSITLSTSGIAISAPQIELTAQTALTASAGGEMQLQGATIMIN